MPAIRPTFTATCLSIFCIAALLMATASIAAADKSPADRALPAWQADLLELGFDAATAIPTDPHIKDRSKAQQATVETCFQLDQPARALGCIMQIDNWRRGIGLADYAAWCADHDATAIAEQYLKQAEGICRAAHLADWRRGEIRLSIARAYARLGDADRAARFEQGNEAYQQGRGDTVRAELADDGEFQKHMTEADRLIALGDFEVTRNVLKTYASLFDRFYADADRRVMIESKIHAAWGKLPLFVRIDTLLALCESAIAHGDAAGALRLVDEAQQIADEAEWPAEYHVPLMGRLAVHRARAGDTAKARDQAAIALAVFDQAKASIFDIDRAEALVPVAEAYAAADDRDAALATYRLALDHAILNPNSRPRAEDLALICRSMAAGAVEPDAALWARMRKIHQGLGQPW